MPIYEYRCEACGHELEVIQKMTDKPLVDCPQCGATSLKKCLSAVGFRLKGGGWYETDFKQGGNKKNLHQSGEDASKTGNGNKTPADKGATTESTTKSSTPTPSAETTK